ncbi:MAG: DUF4294 domain-containing protein [Bacteroidetes bacterium]|nr:DUF4294 domain-containing protein [Bacteroidota bacterium]
MRKLMALCLLSFGLAPDLFAQDTIRHMVVPGKIIQGDTVPYIDMRTVVIFPQMDMKAWSDLVGYERLVYNVKKVYPYAKLAGVKLTEYKSKLDSLPNQRERKKFLKKAEKELESQFGDEIKDLNFTQGKLLMKLIYRQTGSSTFAIVKELRGSFNAFIYQTVARLFGYDLRVQYDPEGSDKTVEQIVQMIENGAI